jgi:hypothetical protein
MSWSWATPNKLQLCAIKLWSAKEMIVRPDSIMLGVALVSLISQYGMDTCGNSSEQTSS